MTKLALAALIAAFSLTGPAAALAGSRSQACASGYHTDRGGNCQPNIAEHNRYCPDGLVYEPTFDGWRCDPPPREAY
jgi:hypothetical protein